VKHKKKRIKIDTNKKTAKILEEVEIK